MISATSAAAGASRQNTSYPWVPAEDAFSHNVAVTSAATSFATVSESGMSNPAAAGMEPPSLSTTVDIGPDTNPGAKERQPTLWSKVVKAASVVEGHIAELIGVTQSKYQWAVDEVKDRQLSGESSSQAGPSHTPNEHPTQQISPQAMHRDADSADNV